MIAALLATLARSAWARAALRYGAIVLIVLLFLLALRRSGERAGRMAERLETTEKVNDVQRRMPEAAARRPRSRDDLAERLRDRQFRRSGTLPPVVDYSPAEQSQAAAEIETMPEGTVLVGMLSDYGVLRNHARVCR